MFERQVATDLRKILDPPELTDRIQKAESPAERRAAMQRSCVRRGQQSAGAHEPDIVTPTPFWIEVTRQQGDAAVKKLSQAVGDLEAAHLAGKWDWRFPAAVCRKTGSPTINVCLRLGDLMEVVCATGAGEAHPVDQRFRGLPVVISYHGFLELLEKEWADLT